MDKYITFIGFFSGFCTTVAFVPQAYKVWKTKSTNAKNKVTILANIIGKLLVNTP